MCDKLCQGLDKPEDKKNERRKQQTGILIERRERMTTRKEDEKILLRHRSEQLTENKSIPIEKAIEKIWDKLGAMDDKLDLVLNRQEKEEE